MTAISETTSTATVPEAFESHYGLGKWVAIDRARGEIVGTFADRPFAYAACREHMGRRLEVQDPCNRFDSAWRDGRNISDQAA